MDSYLVAPNGDRKLLFPHRIILKKKVKTIFNALVDYKNSYMKKNGRLSYWPWLHVQSQLNPSSSRYPKFHLNRQPPTLSGT